MTLRRVLLGSYALDGPVAIAIKGLRRRSASVRGRQLA